MDHSAGVGCLQTIFSIVCMDVCIHIDCEVIYWTSGVYDFGNSLDEDRKMAFGLDSITCCLLQHIAEVVFDCRIESRTFRALFGYLLYWWNIGASIDLYMHITLHTH